MSRTLFANFHDFFVPLLQRCRQQGMPVDFVMFVSPHAEAIREEYGSRSEFEATELFSSRYHFFPDELESWVGPQHIVLEEAYFPQLMESEFYFMLWSDRACLQPATVRQRKRMHRRYFQAFLNLLRSRDISAVFFPYTPHGGWDQALFYACKALGVHTRLLTPTMIEDRVFLREDFRTPMHLPEEYLRQTSAEELSQQLAPEFLQAAWQDSAILQSQRELLASVTQRREQSRWRQVLERPRLVKHLLGPTFAICNSFYKESYLPIHKRVWYRLPFLKRRKKLRDYYDTHSQRLDARRPFVLMPLHLEPEATTQPEGLMFEDQIMAVRVLARALPEGWVLYVKENPAQFSNEFWQFGSYHYRELADYEQMLAEPNVRFLALNEPMSDVIGQAEVVASIKGTAGWEALRDHQKPAIVFTPSWYSACPSCFLVHSVEECRAAIRRTQELSADAVRLDVLRFLSYAQSLFFVGSFARAFHDKTSRTDEQIYDSMAEAFVKELRACGIEPRSA